MGGGGTANVREKLAQGSVPLFVCALARGVYVQIISIIIYIIIIDIIIHYYYILLLYVA